MLNIFKWFIIEETKSEITETVFLEISVGPMNPVDLTEVIGEKLAKDYCKKHGYKFSHQNFAFENARKTRVTSRSYVILTR